MTETSKMSIIQSTNIIKQEMCWITCARHRDEKVSEHRSNWAHKEVIEINILNKRVTKQMKKAQETHTSDDLRICGKMRKIWLKCIEEEQ